ncbi:MAG: hypothetical protein NTU91_14390, partial [Chloroflexi bacterium]|nr:hypothetical protein [Chloroflexota bacterium]
IVLFYFICRRLMSQRATLLATFLFALEDLAPDAFGRHGAYSTLLVTKPGKAATAPGGVRA